MQNGRKIKIALPERGATLDRDQDIFVSGDYLQEKKWHNLAITFDDESGMYHNCSYLM